MGGKIDVQSEKGKGSVFTVRLHFEEVNRGAVPESVKSTGTKRNLAGKKILLCEDNLLNREIAVALLKEKEIDSIIAENGEEGVRKFAGSAEGEFDAILMDIRMPVMDGFEAARQIRKTDRNDAATIPIIAMTADAFADDVQKCLSAGMNAHVAKPIDPDKLMRTLSEYIR